MTEKKHIPSSTKENPPDSEPGGLLSCLSVF
jgi:hypothetical protein